MGWTGDNINKSSIPDLLILESCLDVSFDESDDEVDGIGLPLSVIWVIPDPGTV